MKSNILFFLIKIFIIFITINEIIVYASSQQTITDSKSYNKEIEELSKLDYPTKFSGQVYGEDVSIGNIVGKKIDNNPTLKPDDVKVTGNFDLKKESGTTNIKVSQSSSEINLEQKDNNIKTPYVDIKGIQENSNIKLNEEGRIVSATNLKTNENNGNIIAMGGMKFHAPHNSIVNMDDLDKTKPIRVDLEQGSKISIIPTKDKDKGKDEEQRFLQYRTLNGFVKLPEEFAEQIGFKGKNVDFQGFLSHDGSNWFINKEQKLTLRIDGKEINFQNLYNMKVPDPKTGELKTLTGVNEKAYLFPGKTNLNNEIKNGFKGAYFVIDKDGIGAGSNNDLASHSIRIQENNPWEIKVAKNGYLAGWALDNSNIFFNKDSQIITNGKTIIDNDYIYYKTDPENNKIFFNQGNRVFGFNEGDLTKFKNSANTPITLLPFRNNEALPFKSKIVIGMSNDPNPNNPTNFRVEPMKDIETKMSRVIFGEMPKYSNGKIVISMGELVPVIKEAPSNQKQVPEVINSILNEIKKSSELVDNPYSSDKNSKIDMFKEVGPAYNPNIHTKGLILEFSSPICGPCRNLAPYLKNWASINKDAKILPINGEVNSALLKKYGISRYPTAVLINPETGEIIEKAVGVENINSLLDKIKNK
ncbi:MAG: thioredoxin family protein [Candidatus Pacearchaeota archaeon]